MDRNMDGLDDHIFIKMSTKIKFFYLDLFEDILKVEVIIIKKYVIYSSYSIVI